MGGAPGWAVNSRAGGCLQHCVHATCWLLHGCSQMHVAGCSGMCRWCSGSGSGSGSSGVRAAGVEAADAADRQASSALAGDMGCRGVVCAPSRGRHAPAAMLPRHSRSLTSAAHPLPNLVAAATRSCSWLRASSWRLRTRRTSLRSPPAPTASALCSSSPTTPAPRALWAATPLVRCCCRAAC